MPKYYVNKNAQSNGDHEVHTTNCPTPPNPKNRMSLGEHLMDVRIAARIVTLPDLVTAQQYLLVLIFTFIR
jgi:hypothetical protein